MPQNQNVQYKLAARPVGLPKPSDWERVESPIPSPRDGEVLVEVQLISVDPAMRGWMNEMRSYIEPVKLGASFVRKPLYSREGANVALIRDGVTVVEQQGPYGAEGFIRQAFAPLPNFSSQYPVLGSWLIDHTPCGLSIREDENPITGNTSRFLPHAIL